MKRSKFVLKGSSSEKTEEPKEQQLLQSDARSSATSTKKGPNSLQEQEDVPSIPKFFLSQNNVDSPTYHADANHSCSKQYFETSFTSPLTEEEPTKNEPDVSTFFSNVAEFKFLQENQEASSYSKVALGDEESISDISMDVDEESTPFLFQEFNKSKKQEGEHEEHMVSSFVDREMFTEPLPCYADESSESILSQELDSDEDMEGMNDSFKNLIDYLSASDENITKFLLGDDEEY